MTTSQAYRDRRAALIRAGISNKQVAVTAQVSTVYVWQTLTGERTGYRIRRVIADLCGVDVTALWPDTPPQYRRAA
jgi:lambda repressor-like predicted transcriptional regulator